MIFIHARHSNLHRTGNVPVVPETEPAASFRAVSIDSLIFGTAAMTIAGTGAGTVAAIVVAAAGGVLALVATVALAAHLILVEIGLPPRRPRRGSSGRHRR